MTAATHIEAQLLDVARAGVDVRPANARALEERVNEAIAPRVIDLVTRRPGIGTTLLANLIPGGNAVARLLAQQGKLRRVGKSYFPPPEVQPKDLGALRVNVALANHAMVGEGALGERGILRAKLVQDFIDAHPGIRHEDLAAHFVHPGARASSLARALVLLLNVQGIERTRRPSDGAYRYWPAGAAPADEPRAIVEKIPGFDDVDPDPPVSSPALTTAAPATPPTEPVKEEIPVTTLQLESHPRRNGKHTKTADETRNKVLDYVNKHPGGVRYNEIEGTSAKVAADALTKLHQRKLVTRRGSGHRGSPFVYFPMGPLEAPVEPASTNAPQPPRPRRDRASTTPATTSRRSRPAAGDVPLEELAELRQLLDQYAAHREAAEEALAAYRELATRIGLHAEGTI